MSDLGGGTGMQPGVLYVPRERQTRSMVKTRRQMDAEARKAMAKQDAALAQEIVIEEAGGQPSPASEPSESEYDSPDEKKLQSAWIKSRRSSRSDKETPPDTPRPKAAREPEEPRPTSDDSNESSIGGEDEISDTDEVDDDDDDASDEDFETPPPPSSARRVKKHKLSPARVVGRKRVKPMRKRVKRGHFNASGQDSDNGSESVALPKTPRSTGDAQEDGFGTGSVSSRNDDGDGRDDDSEADSDTVISVSNTDFPPELFRLRPDADMRNGGFADGLQRELDSWEECDSEIDAFAARTFQILRKRTSKSAAIRNRHIARAEDKIPARMDRYCQTWMCTHAIKPQVKKTKKGGRSGKPRKSRRLRYCRCSATLNARVTVLGGKHTIVVTPSGYHNHEVSAELYRIYPEVRLPMSQHMMYDLERFQRAGAPASGVRNVIREELGTACKTRDVLNVFSKIRREQTAGTTLEQRVEAYLRDFVGADGNCANLRVDSETREARTISFQTASQRRLFAAFPEVVMVDCTHSTNRSKFVLLSFVVHDVFGKGQYINHSLMNRETMDNMEDAVEDFKKNNDRWQDIRCFVIDKDFKERKILARHFPDARILLCYYHVIKYFGKKIRELVRGTKDEKDEIMCIMRALVYAKSRAVYDALKLLLAKALAASMKEDDGDHDTYPDDETDTWDDDDETDEDLAMEDDQDVQEVSAMALRDARHDAEVARGKTHRFFKYFDDNWESCVQEWALFHRQNVPHLGNHTNNRIEAKFGQLKRIVLKSLDMHECIRAIHVMQGVSDDEYYEELMKPGTRISYRDDSELIQLLNFVSDHAYKLVEVEYAAVKTAKLHYQVREEGSNAVLVCAGSVDSTERVEHTLDINTFKCSCLFAQCRLLPCRHAFFYRQYKCYENVIPFKHINTRWSLRNPINNISQGSVPRGYYHVRPATDTGMERMSQGDKFMKVMAAMKPIASAIAVSKSGEFDRMLEAVEKFGGLISRGLVPNFDTGATRSAQRDPVDVAVVISDTDKASSTEGDRDADEDVTHDPTLANFKIPEVVNLKPARDSRRAADAKSKLATVMKAAKDLLPPAFPKTHSTSQTFRPRLSVPPTPSTARC